MFRITLSATSSNLIDYKHTQIAVQGSSIVYDGKAYDFSAIPTNSEVQAEHPAVGVIKNINGVIHVTLSYLFNSSMAELKQSQSWSDYIFDVVSGEVPCPIRWRENVELPNIDVVNGVGDKAPIIGIEGDSDVQA